VKPADPTLEGYTFAGWCTLDGTEYDFGATVLKSVTVYAKWINGAGITYVASENVPAATNQTGNTLTWIICIAIGLVAAAASVLIIWGGRKRVNKEK
jgi:uncharacterized repeat protein (TIGR02543 family)